jgi:hypothetical protein
MTTSQPKALWMSPTSVSLRIDAVSIWGQNRRERDSHFRVMHDIHNSWTSHDRRVPKKLRSEEDFGYLHDLHSHFLLLGWQRMRYVHLPSDICDHSWNWEDKNFVPWGTKVLNLLLNGPLIRCTPRVLDQICILQFTSSVFLYVFGYDLAVQALPGNRPPIDYWELYRPVR